MPTTTGTKKRTLSARRWIGARLRCASATIETILASTVSAPTFSAPMTNAPVPFIVPPDHVARPLVDRQRLAGQQLFVDADRPSRTSPSTGTDFAGSHAQAVADLDFREGDVVARRRRAYATRDLGRKIEQGASAACGLVARRQFKDLAEQCHEHDDDGSGLK